MQVGVRELKGHLSEYLERVQAGQTVIVTSRGRPVARLEPVETICLPPAIEALRRAGQVQWDGRPTTFSVTVQLAPGESIAEQIVAERE